MIKSRIAVAGALLAVAGAANAGFTVTPTITSDYDFRGFTQTMKDPAFQLGATYTTESGFYGSVWGSNVDFGPGNPDLEFDFSAGFAGGDAATSYGYDLGVVYYTYPNAGSVNYWEGYAGISKSYYSAKLWVSPDFGGSSDSAVYVEGNVAYPLPQDFAILGHVGYSFGDYWSGGSKYTDYSVGLGKAFGAINLNVKYVDGSDNLDGRVIASISTTLPWASN